jgi:hypothetical protein
MDNQRFDALARALATGTSRRTVLKGLAGGAVGGTLLIAGATSQPAAAQQVACTTGTQNACPAGYICCPTTNTPGGPGICHSASVGCPAPTTAPTQAPTNAPTSAATATSVPALPVTGSGPAAERGASRDWLAPLALAGAALVGLAGKLARSHRAE